MFRAATRPSFVRAVLGVRHKGMDYTVGPSGKKMTIPDHMRLTGFHMDALPVPSGPFKENDIRVKKKLNRYSYIAAAGTIILGYLMLIVNEQDYAWDLAPKNYDFDVLKYIEEEAD